eukprot:1150913-Pelagomonas_calceolata.AAC.4
MTCGRGAAFRKALVAVSRANIRPFWQALKDCATEYKVEVRVRHKCSFIWAGRHEAAHQHQRIHAKT